MNHYYYYYWPYIYWPQYVPYQPSAVPWNVPVQMLPATGWRCICGAGVAPGIQSCPECAKRLPKTGGTP